MTVFGRDTLITCLQTLIFGPELAGRALEALAGCRRARTTPSIDAEPGKIVHEVRSGRGRADLVRALLRHGRRDAALPRPALGGLALDGRRRARAAAARARAARRSAGSTTTATATATASSSTSAGRLAGSRTSRGRTPATRSASTTARSRRRRSRRARCRATSTTPSCASPSSRAPSGATCALADRLEAEAAELRIRFDEAFWVDERGGYYALALDGEKRPGRLALLEHRPSALERDRPARARRGDRRPADGRRALVGLGRPHDVDRATPAYNPLSYHNGTVWPHDNSLIAWGLARAGRWPECARSRSSLLEAARHFDWSAAGGVRGLHARARRRSRSPTRPQPVRRRGPRARRSCSCSCCSGSSPTAAQPRAPHRRCGGARVAGRPPAAGRARVRPLLGRRGRERARDRRMKDRRPQPGLVPGPAAPATAASSGSSRCSPTGSRTRATR